MKRLQHQPKGVIRVSSDNLAYDPFSVNLQDERTDLRILRLWGAWFGSVESWGFSGWNSVSQGWAKVRYNASSLSGYGKEAVMQLEDYFVFLAPDDIRIRGTRIGIEHILYDYIHNARSPEEIAQDFQTVTLMQVYATILYYLENREMVGQYLADWLDYTMRSEAEHDRHPPRITERLRQLRSAQEVKQVPA